MTFVDPLHRKIVLRVKGQKVKMNIKQIKEQYTCLDYLGEPLKKVASGYLYRTPWREDRHPSLSVSPNGKGWHDFSTGEHGNLIDLVAKCIGSNDFARICAEFGQGIPSSPTVKNLNEGKGDRADFARFSLVRLQTPKLKEYLVKERGISPDTAQSLGIVEARYSMRPDIPTDLYALAYPNDKGGYELRGAPYEGNTKGFKGSKAPKGITTHIRQENVPYVVFEGFIDMLSFDTMMKEQGKSQTYNYVTLNSTVNAGAAIEVLKGVKSQIFLCLDNDQAGDEATAEMLKVLVGAQDIRKGISPFNDVNELHLHRRAVQKQLQENYEKENQPQEKSQLRR